MRVGPSGAAVQEQVSNQPELLCSTPEDRVSIESEKPCDRVTGDGSGSGKAAGEGGLEERGWQ
jgi:hypothetical protein